WSSIRAGRARWCDDAASPGGSSGPASGGEAARTTGADGAGRPSGAPCRRGSAPHAPGGSARAGDRRGGVAVLGVGGTVGPQPLGREALGPVGRHQGPDAAAEAGSEGARGVGAVLTGQALQG